MRFRMRCFIVVTRSEIMIAKPLAQIFKRAKKKALIKLFLEIPEKFSQVSQLSLSQIESGLQKGSIFILGKWKMTDEFAVSYSLIAFCICQA